MCDDGLWKLQGPADVVWWGHCWTDRHSSIHSYHNAFPIVRRSLSTARQTGASWLHFPSTPGKRRMTFSWISVGKLPQRPSLLDISSSVGWFWSLSVRCCIGLRQRRYDRRLFSNKHGTYKRIIASIKYHNSECKPCAFNLNRWSKLYSVQYTQKSKRTAEINNMISGNKLSLWAGVSWTLPFKICRDLHFPQRVMTPLHTRSSLPYLYIRFRR